jgi:hypothetical protein
MVDCSAGREIGAEKAMTSRLCRYNSGWRFLRSPMLLIARSSHPLLYDHKMPVHCPTLVQTLGLVEQEINQGEPGTAGRPIKFDLEQEMIWGKRGASTNHIAEPTAEQIQIISSSRISARRTADSANDLQWRERWWVYTRPICYRGRSDRRPRSQGMAYRMPLSHLCWGQL